jgi:hypothetical protein
VVGSAFWPTRYPSVDAPAQMEAHRARRSASASRGRRQNGVARPDPAILGYLGRGIRGVVLGHVVASRRSPGRAPIRRCGRHPGLGPGRGLPLYWMICALATSKCACRQGAQQRPPTQRCRGRRGCQCGAMPRGPSDRRTVRMLTSGVRRPGSCSSAPGTCPPPSVRAARPTIARPCLGQQHRPRRPWRPQRWRRRVESGR